MALSIASTFLFLHSSFAASPPTQNPPFALSPLNSTTHGSVLSRDRLILKLDCPGCPSWYPYWDNQPPALLYDFTIPSNETNHEDPSMPNILLNKDFFYPPHGHLGWSWYSGHTFRTAPWNTSIEGYILQPAHFPVADLIGIVGTLPVDNRDGWDLRAVFLRTSGFDKREEEEGEGEGEEEGFWNHWGNVSAIELIVRKANVSEDTDLMVTTKMTQQWSFVWWQIIPMTVMHEWDNCTNCSWQSVPMPDGLRDKLLGEEQDEDSEDLLSEARVSGRVNGPADLLLDLFWVGGLALVFFLGGLLLFILAVVTAKYGGDVVVKGVERCSGWRGGNKQKKGKGRREDEGPLLEGQAEDRDDRDGYDTMSR